MLYDAIAFIAIVGWIYAGLAIPSQVGAELLAREIF